MKHYEYLNDPQDHTGKHTAQNRRLAEYTPQTRQNATAAINLIFFENLVYFSSFSLYYKPRDESKIASLRSGACADLVWRAGADDSRDKGTHTKARGLIK